MISIILFTIINVFCLFLFFIRNQGDLNYQNRKDLTIKLIILTKANFCSFLMLHLLEHDIILFSLFHSLFFINWSMNILCNSSVCFWF